MNPTHANSDGTRLFILIALGVVMPFAAHAIGWLGQ